MYRLHHTITGGPCGLLYMNNSNTTSNSNNSNNSSNNSNTNMVIHRSSLYVTS